MVGLDVGETYFKHSFAIPCHRYTCLIPRLGRVHVTIETINNLYFGNRSIIGKDELDVLPLLFSWTKYLNNTLNLHLENLVSNRISFEVYQQLTIIIHTGRNLH